MEKKTNRNKYCYNCGSAEHKKVEWKLATKCFKCNKYGHISRNYYKQNQNEEVLNVIVHPAFLWSKQITTQKEKLHNNVLEVKAAIYREFDLN